MGNLFGTNFSESQNSAFNVLITSAGGLTGTYLVKHFLSHRKDVRLVAADIELLIPAQLWADACYIVPPTNSTDFLDAIKNIIQKEQIDIIIPVASHDVNFFCENHVKDALKDVTYLTLNEEDNSLLNDKLECYQYLKSLGLNVPQIYHSLGEAVFPCIFKARKSSGGKRNVVLEQPEDYSYWKKKINDAVLTEYIEGDEFTVDCLFNQAGDCLGYNVRQRLKTVGGAVSVCRNAYKENIEREILCLEQTKKLAGPINFQYRRTKTGQCCIFDFNPRLPAGGLPLSVESGLDIPCLLLDLCMGKDVPVHKCDIQKDGTYMIRYYEELFVQ